MENLTIRVPAWHKKILESLTPTMQKFAEVHKGHLRTLENEVTIRILHNASYVNG